MYQTFFRVRIIDADSFAFHSVHVITGFRIAESAWPMGILSSIRINAFTLNSAKATNVATPPISSRKSKIIFINHVILYLYYIDAGDCAFVLYNLELNKYFGSMNNFEFFAKTD